MAELCDDQCRLEWVLPYLLSYAAPDRAHQHLHPGPRGAGSGMATGTSTSPHSSIILQPQDDALPRAIVLAQLPRVVSRIAALPRTERALFTSYVVPALAALPERRGHVLRAAVAQAAPACARAAQVLHDVSIQGLLAAASGACDAFLHGRLLELPGVAHRPCSDQQPR